MSQLPASWNLRTRKRTDGKLDILGKDDSGQEYRVRTTDHAEVTERDLAELKDADRESYSNPTSRTKDFVSRLLAPGQARKAQDEARDLDDWTADAERVCYAGFERKGATVGTSRAYRENFDRIFGGN